MSRSKKPSETPATLAKATGKDVIVYTNERGQLDFRAVENAVNFTKWPQYMWTV